MENPSLNEKAKFENLGRYYLLALSVIALSIILSQFVVQKFIAEQKSESQRINLFGKQRMFSQQTTKYSLLLRNNTDISQRKKNLESLRKTLKEWGKIRRNLQINLPEVPDKLRELSGQAEDNYIRIINSAEGLIMQLNQNITVSPENLQFNSKQILENEASFMRQMDQLVVYYNSKTSNNIRRFKNTQLLLFALTLVLILFEIGCVFLPSAKSIRETFRRFADAEAKSKKIALETGALYTSLEQAYQDLLEVDVTVEDFTVYGKSDNVGNFTYFADSFLRIMEFEEEKPGNFFDWLEQQGYDKEYLQSIKALVLAGEPWSGEVKVVNISGDFVWLKINLVPVLNDEQRTEELMLIGTDVTEKKEAEAISQEINKEKIAHKVKEQQFRSALILEGQEEERKRISRDMHDGIGQLLSAMKFNLEAIHSMPSDFERNKLSTSKELLKKVIREVRRISFNLTPSALSDYGIVPVLNKFSREIGKLTDLQVSFENKTGFLSRLEGKVENNLYRIVQEAVNNAIKYAEAKEINISISHNSRYLNLEITDNGKGFDVQKLEEKGHFSASGHGIFNIKERANFIAAQCTIASEEGKGTTISINVPLD